jgi:uncharacterized protein YkwD
MTLSGGVQAASAMTLQSFAAQRSSQRTSVMADRAQDRRDARVAALRDRLHNAASSQSNSSSSKSSSSKSSSSKSSSSKPKLIVSSSSKSFSSSSSNTVSNDSPGVDLYAEVVRLVNLEREKEGLKPYAYNKILESSAVDYAQHMDSEKCFSHTCGSTLKERMHASGYYHGGGFSYSYGENIARGQDSAAEVMEDWMNSPPHHDAILSSKFLEIGIGKSGEYWVQHFGAIR